MRNDRSSEWLYYWQALTIMPNVQWQAEYSFDVGMVNPWTGKPGRHRFDWALPPLRIAVEIDGGVWERHGGRHGTDADRRKLAIAAALGWLVFRFSPQMLERNAEICVRLVEQAIAQAKNYLEAK
jgi:hypothetical protein